MLIVARVVGIALALGVLGAASAKVLFLHEHDVTLAALVLCCVGALIGAAAGAAREIAVALRSRAA